MIEHKLIRVEANSPDRCQGSGMFGQCPFRKEPGSDYCSRHCGIKNGEGAQKKKDLRNYRLTKFQQRVNEFADSDVVKGLREEIGILRLVLEQLLNSIASPVEFAIHSGRVADLVLKVEKLVTSCSRLEQTSGSLLDKDKVTVLAAAMVDVISKYITNPDIVDDLSEELAFTLTQV